jgi:hypothetical protein
MMARSLLKSHIHPNTGYASGTTSYAAPSQTNST